MDSKPVRVRHEGRSITPDWRVKLCVTEKGSGRFAQKITGIFPLSQISCLLETADPAMTQILFSTGHSACAQMPMDELDTLLNGRVINAAHKGASHIIDLTEVTNNISLNAHVFNGLNPGQLIPGQGIYLGKYTPKDRDGKSLSQTFNVFAAPEDLGGTATYLETVKKISKLKNWNGHNGANYATDKELYQAINNGTYNGEWIIPTRDILTALVDNLLKHKDTGAFNGTYIMSNGGSDCPDWYWSCTENRDNPGFVWIVRLSDGGDHWNHKDINRLSCRPVRLVPVPG